MIHFIYNSMTCGFNMPVEQNNLIDYMQYQILLELKFYIKKKLMIAIV